MAIINIAMGIFLLVVLLTGTYLWSHRTGKFLSFDTNLHPKMKTAITHTSLTLLVIGTIGVFSFAFQSKIFYLVILLLSSLVVALFSVVMTKLNK